MVRVWVATVSLMGLALGGCQQQAASPNNAMADDVPVPGNVAAPAQDEANAADPVTAAAQEQIALSSDLLIFKYGWPREGAEIAPLNTWLRGNGETILKRWQAQAKRDFAASKDDGWVWRTYSYEERYAVAADTPRMLVMISDGYQYTGGAHGMPIATAIIWDKGSARRLATGQVIDVSALKRIAQARFCEILDEQRAEKRGEPVPADRPDMFDECIDIAKQMIVPVSTGGSTLDTIRVIVGPYEAGPYAEGSYVIDLPMTTDLLPAVKAGYRAAFTSA